LYFINFNRRNDMEGRNEGWEEAYEKAAKLIAAFEYIQDKDSATLIGWGGRLSREIESMSAWAKANLKEEELGALDKEWHAMPKAMEVLWGVNFIQPLGPVESANSGATSLKSIYERLEKVKKVVADIGEGKLSERNNDGFSLRSNEELGRGNHCRNEVAQCLVALLATVRNLWEQRPYREDIKKGKAYTPFLASDCAVSWRLLEKMNKKVMEVLDKLNNRQAAPPPADPPAQPAPVVVVERQRPPADPPAQPPVGQPGDRTLRNAGVRVLGLRGGAGGGRAPGRGY
jgi:hypothetical protein